MITYEEIIDAQRSLVEYWGEDGKKVIEAIFNERKESISHDTFFKSCVACGGNWGGMLMTGIKNLYPKVYDIIPEDMGAHAWGAICCIIILLGVDSTLDE